METGSAAHAGMFRHGCAQREFLNQLFILLQLTGS